MNNDYKVGHLIYDAFVGENHLERVSLVHREIYLSDARKVQPDKLKTILRYQVK